MDGEWLVGCGIYVDGHRLPGEADWRTALDVAREHGGFVWLGIRDPGEAEFTQVAHIYGLHELAIEQAITVRQRPKVEYHGSATLFVLRTTRYVEHAELTDTSEVVETGEILIFLGPDFVITVRHGVPGALGTVRADLEQRPDLLTFGPWAVAHAVCDRLVDSYLEVAQEFEIDLDQLEERVFGDKPSSRASQIYQLKRELMEFRRAVAPLTRPMNAILEARDQIPKELRKYFSDVNDHLLRTIERITAYDELLNSILQARLAQVSVDQNNDMRKIASWAAIAAAQTAIAGIYGMNFDFMPELHWRIGYPLILSFMLLVAVLMYRGFRKSGWL